MIILAFSFPSCVYTQGYTNIYRKKEEANKQQCMCVRACALTFDWMMFKDHKNFVEFITFAIHNFFFFVGASNNTHVERIEPKKGLISFLFFQTFLVCLLVWSLYRMMMMIDFCHEERSSTWMQSSFMPMAFAQSARAKNRYDSLSFLTLSIKMDRQHKNRHHHRWWSRHNIHMIIALLNWSEHISIK